MVVLSPARPSQPGDICILLESNDPDEIQALHRRQQALQQHYGGRIVQPVHQTCQRLEVSSPQALEALLERLGAFCSHFHLGTEASLLALTAVSVTPLYSHYRQAHILKWIIAHGVDDPAKLPLRRIAAGLEETIRSAGVTSLYPPGWFSTLITALEDIPAPEPDEPCLLEEPYKLFTPGLLSVSRIANAGAVRPGENGIGYEILAKFPFESHPDAETVYYP